MRIKIIEFILALVFASTRAYHVLVVFPFPTKSHSILGDGFVRNLLKAGHQVKLYPEAVYSVLGSHMAPVMPSTEKWQARCGVYILKVPDTVAALPFPQYVTYITPSPWTKPTPNLYQVNVSDNYKFMGTDKESFLNIDKLMKKDAVMSIDMLMMLCLNVAENTLKQPEVKDLLLKPNAKFHAVISEWMFSELFAGLGVVFDCPLIWSSSLDSHWMIRRFMDEVTNPAYTADYASTNIPPFNFVQRIEELWYQIRALAIYRFMIKAPTEQAYEEIYSAPAKAKGKTLPPLENVSQNASLMFLNSHVSFGTANSVPHNFKYIGGYHIDTPIQPLPENLKTIMDIASNGVIYFSMGSVLKSRDMSQELKGGFLEMFSKLKQTVIWKFEEVLDDMPHNVHIVQWAPQPSILNHPNCVLFITHGGLLSTTEAIHSGVPIIGIPMFADQFYNMEKAEHKGFAKNVDLNYDTPKVLHDAINEMLTNPRYKEIMKHMSKLYHDRPRLPREELVYWVEYVIRNKGAHHLRSTALLATWYQKMFIDLIIVIITLMTLSAFVANIVLKNLTYQKCKRKFE